MHLLSVCPAKAYIHRHNAALQVLYYHFRHSYEIDQAETNIIVKDKQKRTKYQDLLFELFTMYPGYDVVLVVPIIGVLEGIRAMLLLGRMQQAVILSFFAELAATYRPVGRSNCRQNLPFYCTGAVAVRGHSEFR
ncbi:hypothetical protein Zmor_002061 [Zophobas morio]|uniref:Uncharacterized protein n=1 Tax=Zophobas morio TaxID=2755281 RepID=A0AA38J6S4_9CUCU|nr:hypothetical protein Zmor_002061 [Zophobas morio]